MIIMQDTYQCTVVIACLIILSTELNNHHVLHIAHAAAVPTTIATGVANDKLAICMHK